MRGGTFIGITITGALLATITRSRGRLGTKAHGG